MWTKEEEGGASYVQTPWHCCWRRSLEPWRSSLVWVWGSLRTVTAGTCSSSRDRYPSSCQRSPGRPGSPGSPYRNIWRRQRTTQRRTITWTHSVWGSWSWAEFTCSSWRCHTGWPRGRRSTRCSTTGSRLRRSDTAFQRSSPANGDNAVMQHWWWMEVRHLQSGLGWSKAHVDVGKDKSLGC